MDPPANEGTQVTQSCEPANATIATQSAAPPNPGDKPPLHPQTQVNEKASGRKSSKAWDHFNKVIDEKGNIKGVCKHCGKEYLANGRVHGTSNLLSHIKNCAKNPDKDFGKGQQTLAFEHGQDSVNLVATNFIEVAAKKALAEMIILDELPFRFVENYGFRKYSQILQPKFKTIPSRHTIARDVINIYLKEREKLSEFLRFRRICLTTDTWTSIQNLSYMCLTAHFIDDDWKLHKRILNFCQVQNHKGETVGRQIETCLFEWSIESLFTMTVDNASSNDITIKFLKKRCKDSRGTILGHEFLHMRCCAHILNLIVGEGLKEVDESIARVRDAIKYVRSSPNRLANFRKCVEKRKIESKSLLCLDVPTRWNSTYLMLESAVKFEKAFVLLEDEDSNFVPYFRDGNRNDVPPTEADWNKCRVFVKFLRLFYYATKRFSGSLYVTSNAFFDEIHIIQLQILHMIKSEDQTMRTMALNMKLKFDKYWGRGDKINLLLYIAVVLDPRKKLKYLKFCFQQVYADEVVNDVVGQVKILLYRLYENYASINFPSVQTANVDQELNVPVDGDCDDMAKLLASQFSQFLDEEDEVVNKSDVDRYLGESCEVSNDPKFDILAWWKVNSSKYAVLSQVTKDVLAVPVSTVASESAFSTGGRILDPFRSSLSPMMVESLICSQNWLQSSVPISLCRVMDDVEQFEEYEPEHLGTSTGNRSSTVVNIDDPGNF